MTLFKGPEMKIKPNINPVFDIIRVSSLGHFGIEALQVFVDEYENGEIEQTTLDALYKIAKGITEDEANLDSDKYGRRKEDLANIAVKHLHPETMVKGQPKKNSTEQYREGIQFCIHYQKYREDGLSRDLAIDRLVSENRATRSYIETRIKRYLKSAKMLIENVGLGNLIR
jgi:hypothetical protein